MTNSKYNWKNESDKISKKLVSQDEEEFLSKRRARELFDNGILKKIFKWELLKESLISDIEDRDVFMNGINQSYEYENMGKYDVKELEELD